MLEMAACRVATHQQSGYDVSSGYQMLDLPGWFTIGMPASIAEHDQ